MSNCNDDVQGMHNIGEDELVEALASEVIDIVRISDGIIVEH